MTPSDRGPDPDPGLGPDPDLMCTAQKLFADLADEPERDDRALTTSWRRVADLGLTLVGIPEERGGSGGTPADFLAVVFAAAERAVELPLAENWLAAWLLAGAGQNVPAGPLAVAPPTRAPDRLRLREGRVTGTARDVPAGREASALVALAGGPAGHAWVVSFPPSVGRVVPGEDLAGRPRDAITLDGAAVDTWQTHVVSEDLFWRAALVRAAQIAGALAGVDRITRRYTGERVQFGKPIAAFQAVQQHIVTIAQAAETTAITVWRAAHAAARGGGSFEISVAKLTADENARVAAKAAHQAHGAIGMTQEYPLHRYTRRLNAWRQEFGSEVQLAEALGAATAGAHSFARAISDHANGIEVPCPI